MLVVLDDALFRDEQADDVALLTVICEGKDRYKVCTRPAYRPAAREGVNWWLAQQSPRVQAVVRIVLEQGFKAPPYSPPGAPREPQIIVEHRDAPEWPDSFESGPARLPLASARELLLRPLRLLLENGRNDWSFLAKIVPSAWKARWRLAVEKRWIEEQNAGGITEMRRIIEVQLALDPVRRLRTWAMFDSDGQLPGDASDQARDAKAACETWQIAHHRLRRRAIENYIPKEVLTDWAWRRHHLADKREMAARVRAYCELETDGDRHHLDMKERFHKHLAQHVWGDGELDFGGRPIVYQVSDDALVRDGFGVGQGSDKLGEREELFQTLFSRL